MLDTGEYGEKRCWDSADADASAAGYKGLGRLSVGGDDEVDAALVTPVTPAAAAAARW